MTTSIFEGGRKDYEKADLSGIDISTVFVFKRMLQT
jgi:hypothetical protein